jgi:hypothetical protein
MNELADLCQKSCKCVTVGQPLKDSDLFPDGCGCALRMRQLVHEEIKIERDRVAKEEAAQWERAFGAATPSDRKARRELTIRIASAGLPRKHE